MPRRFSASVRSSAPRVADPLTLTHTFRMDPATWGAFVAKCDERGIPPATKVADIVARWALTEWPDDDMEWTP